jgi:UDP-glucose 4-epimerase
VSVIDDLSGGSATVLPADAELQVVDVADPSVADVIADLHPDVVVHAAAQVSVPLSMEDPERDLAVNVRGTQNVIKGSRAARAAKLVFISSGGAIYGETAGASEETLPAPESFYGVHKYTAERYVEMSGMSHAIARLSNVYGPGQRAGLEGAVVAIFADALSAGRDITIHGTGRQSRDFVFVEDVVDALVGMIDSQSVGLWNVGTGTSLSILDLLSHMQQAIAPATSVSYEDVREGDVAESRLIVDRIREELGWRAHTSLYEGVRLLG